jgi:hypothetical protein
MKTTNILVGIGIAYDNARETKQEFNHEHEFVLARVKGTTGFFVQYINCGTYYCDLCGKTLKNINRVSYK